VNEHVFWAGIVMNLILNLNQTFDEENQISVLENGMIFVGESGIFAVNVLLGGTEEACHLCPALYQNHGHEMVEVFLSVEGNLGGTLVEEVFVEEWLIVLLSYFRLFVRRSCIL